MALSFVASSAWVSSTTAVTPGIPTGTTAGDYVVICLVSKYEDASLGGAPAGWIDLGTAINANRPAGTDNGGMRGRLFGKVWATGNTMPALAPTPNNVSSAHATTYRVAAGKSFAVEAASCVDDVADSTLLFAAGALNLTAGDGLHVEAVINGDAPTFGAGTLTALGATMSASSTNTADLATTTGTDMRMRSVRYTVVAGTSSAAPSLSTALGGTTTNAVGVGFLLRLREVTPVVSGVADRSFDGVDDKIVTSIGGCDLTGAFTMAVLVKRTDDTTADTLIAQRTSADGNAGKLYIHATLGVGLQTGSSQSYGANPLRNFGPADGWVLCGVTKAAGNVAPRLHVRRANGSWHHEAGTTALADLPSQAGGSLSFGTIASNLDPFRGAMAVAGEWTVALTDAQFEELGANQKTADWANNSGGAPAGLWDFNQDATTTPVNDLTPGGANQTSIIGTTVSTDGPPAWVYGVPLVANLVSQTRTRISRVAGFDQTDVVWSSNLAFTGYQFRVVAADTDPVTAGVQVELNQSPAAGGASGTQYTSTLTDAEIEAVSPAEGAKIVKLFVQNATGWSA